MLKKTVYVLGNLGFEEDSLPLRLIPWLEKEFSDVSFRVLDPTENFPEEEHLVLIDTAINADEVKIVKDADIDKIQQSPSYSLHDFDLGTQLKLMKKIGRLKEVIIICVPPPSKISMEKAFEGVKKEIKKILLLS